MVFFKHDRCPMYQQIIFSCIRNKNLILNRTDLWPMKIIVTSHFTSADFGSFRGRGFRTEGQSGLFCFWLQQSGLFCSCLQRCRTCLALKETLLASGLGYVTIRNGSVRVYLQVGNQKRCDASNPAETAREDHHILGIGDRWLSLWDQRRRR